ncbi:hypothetical protein GJU40_06835 [Bacillus lacus]|uniref:Regulator of SigK n=1 Tax=Metabacillus lacus TaxID=1983721 RepID=A0A7X2LZF6_9BACI|nr:anti-sigma factor [Metabacillus lacus]MRX71887.1 hypothetical protein [Metabacillus lacus]
MTDKKQCDHLIDYISRSLTEQDKEAFEQHMAGCKQCEEEYRELMDLTENLPYLSEPVDPPREMKTRILENVYGETKSSQGTVKQTTEEVPQKGIASWGKGPFIGMAAALMLSLAGNIYLLNSPPDSEQLPQEVVADALSLQPTSPDSSVYAMAMLLTSQQGEQKIILQAANLPPLEEGQYYQAWLIVGETPEPTGYFTPDETGKGSLVYNLGEKRENWHTLAVTIENEPNLPAPQGEVVLAGEL